MKVALTYEQRQKSRLRLRLESGEEIGISRPRGTVLRAGDTVQSASGASIEIVSAPERLLHIEAQCLARVAYHLGNRHVPVQVGEGFLRIAEDHVLEAMLRGLGASVTHVQAPFEPEKGAYSDERLHDHP